MMDLTVNDNLQNCMNFTTVGVINHSAVFSINRISFCKIYNMMTSRLSIVALFLLACHALNVDFIKDFVKLKRSKSVVFFLCDLSEGKFLF